MEKSRPSWVGLWVCSAVTIAICGLLVFASDRFREESIAADLTIQVDDSGILEVEAEEFVRLLASAFEKEPHRPIHVRFKGETTDLTVGFAGRKKNPGIEMGMMAIEIGKTAYVQNGEMVDQVGLSERLRAYNESAVLSGTNPVIALRVASGVSLGRLLEYFELSIGIGRFHYELDGVSANVS